MERRDKDLKSGLGKGVSISLPNMAENQSSIGLNVSASSLSSNTSRITNKTNQPMIQEIQETVSSSQLELKGGVDKIDLTGKVNMSSSISQINTIEGLLREGDEVVNKFLRAQKGPVYKSTVQITLQSSGANSLVNMERENMLISVEIDSQASQPKGHTGANASVNYRPVSNLQFISKIVEKVTLDQFILHCNNNSLLPNYKSAYRKYYSCETSLVKLVNDILWAMEKQLVTVVDILDLSATFDTVDHDLLLEVLEKQYGIVGTARQWYTSYLKPRMFKVGIRGTTSQPRQLDYSVPQGSVQGAFLFIAYASTLDLVVQPSGLELNGFVDDHSVCTTFKPSKLDHKEELDTIATIESAMLDIKSWIDQVHLKLNESKMEFIYFGWPSQLGKCVATTIDVNGKTITRNNITKYLGAHLDSALNFKQHIKTKCKAAMFNLQ